jgi:hypothetical protein
MLVHRGDGRGDGMAWTDALDFRHFLDRLPPKGVRVLQLSGHTRHEAEILATSC